MKDLAQRFIENPLLSTADIPPSRAGLEITCLLNPGVFQFEGKTWLIVRVAERPKQKENSISFPILTETGAIEIIEIPTDGPELDASDARVINYKGVDYLTTLSHLRLLCSEDGRQFYEPENYSPLVGGGILETFGIEAYRVSLINGIYHVTLTAVSDNGVGRWFTNGHVVNPDGDTVTLYYGASDEFVCGAEFSIAEIYSLLKFI